MEKDTLHFINEKRVRLLSLEAIFGSAYLIKDAGLQRAHKPDKIVYSRDGQQSF